MKRKILIVAANPKDTSRLRLDEEIREIENGLKRASKRDDYILKPILATRPVDLRRAMLDFNPNIVHFCGHGEGEEGIAFEDERGKTKLINQEALSGFFELFSDNVDCVVLNACYSEIQARAISKHIRHVIGMKRSIGDKAAIEFATAFYDSLCSGRSVEFSYKIACNATIWLKIPEHHTPILIQSNSNRENNKSSSNNKMMEFYLKPKLLCLLLLDISGSMMGEPIEELNISLNSFLNDLRGNPNTLEHVELALVTFSSSASVVREFTSVYEFDFPKLVASGASALGEAINISLELIERKLQSFKDNGIPYYKPIVILFSDGSPTDNWHIAVNRIHQESTLKRLTFITVGRENSDFDLLKKISSPGINPINIKDLKFSDMFVWVSTSISSIASNQGLELPEAKWTSNIEL